MRESKMSGNKVFSPAFFPLSRVLAVGVKVLSE